VEKMRPALEVLHELRESMLCNAFCFSIHIISLQHLLIKRLQTKIYRNIILFLFSTGVNMIKIYRTINLPVVLYGCETWSLTLREEQRLRVFENGVLRRIF
jgi:hypothetical protein